MLKRICPVVSSSTTTDNHIWRPFLNETVLRAHSVFVNLGDFSRLALFLIEFACMSADWKTKSGGNFVLTVFCWLGFSLLRIHMHSFIHLLNGNIGLSLEAANRKKIPWFAMIGMCVVTRRDKIDHHHHLYALLSQSKRGADAYANICF
jgi:hypothetical protein